MNLLKKELKKKYILSIFIICFTFSMSFFTDINIMYLIIIDGIIGLILMRDKKYD